MTKVTDSVTAITAAWDVFHKFFRRLAKGADSNGPAGSSAVSDTSELSEAKHYSTRNDRGVWENMISQIANSS
jgi:hypothetical protein